VLLESATPRPLRFSSSMIGLARYLGLLSPSLAQSGTSHHLQQGPHWNFTFSTSSIVAGISLSLVSGRMKVMVAEVRAMVPNMRVGMTGLISARAATVVDRVPPTLDTSEEEPTPAALTVVGMSSPVYMYRMAKQQVVVKLPMRANTTIGQFPG